MLLAMQQKATTPQLTSMILVILNISPAKKRGMNKNKFFAQSLGRKSWRYVTLLVLCRQNTNKILKIIR